MKPRQPLDSRTAVVLAAVEAERAAKANAKLTGTPPEKIARLRELLKTAPGTDADTQRDRVLKALQGGPVSTHELRQFLDVVHPPGRVLVLRDDGFEIATDWCVQTTASGHRHRFGVYRLIAAPRTTQPKRRAAA